MSQNVKRILVIHFFWMTFAIYAKGQEKVLGIERDVVYSGGEATCKIQGCESQKWWWFGKRKTWTIKNIGKSDRNKNLAENHRIFCYKLINNRNVYISV